MCPCKRNKKREKWENEGRGEIKSNKKRRKMGENINPFRLFSTAFPRGDHVSQPRCCHSNHSPADYIIQPSTCAWAREALRKSLDMVMLELLRHFETSMQPANPDWFQQWNSLKAYACNHKSICGAGKRVMESDCNANKAKTYTLMKNDKYKDKKKVKKRMRFFFLQRGKHI